MLEVHLLGSLISMIWRSGHAGGAERAERAVVKQRQRLRR